jgi:hypothetical protein
MQITRPHTSAIEVHPHQLGDQTGVVSVSLASPGSSVNGILRTTRKLRLWQHTGAAGGESECASVGMLRADLSPLAENLSTVVWHGPEHAGCRYQHNHMELSLIGRESSLF